MATKTFATNSFVSTYAPLSVPFVTIGNTALLPNERALTGTSNQVIVTDNGAGSTAVLSTPQDIATTSSPTFSNLTLGGGTVTLSVDTNFVLTGGVNGVSFGSTLSVDDTNKRIGINTTAPGNTIDAAVTRTGDDTVMTLRSITGVGSAGDKLNIVMENLGAGGARRPIVQLTAVTQSATSGIGGLAIYTATSFSNLVEKMRILANGNVGIGTTVPGKALEINSSTGANLRLTYDDSDGSATNYTDFSVSSSGDLTVTPSGGDMSVASNLSVANSLTVLDGTSSGTIQTWQTPLDSSQSMTLTYAASTDEFIFNTAAKALSLKTGGSADLNLLPDGNIVAYKNFFLADDAGFIFVGRQDNTNEGGQILFGGAASYDDWSVDVYQNIFRMLTSSASTNTVEIINTGAGSTNLSINGGKLGVGVFTPTNAISIDGQSNQIIWSERNTTSNTAGNSLTVQAGGATSSATDKDGGSLILQPGANTGTGRSLAKIEKYSVALSTGTGDGTATDGEIIGAYKALTNNSAITVCNITVANNTCAAGVIRYAVEVFNGTDVQVEVGCVSYMIRNKAGAIAGNTALKFGNQQTVSSGTLTVTWALSAANPGLLSVNANSSLTPSTGYPRLRYTIDNLTEQAIAIQ